MKSNHVHDNPSDVTAENDVVIMLSLIHISEPTRRS